MGFFGFAAPFMMPVDQLLSLPIHIRYHPEELVLGVLNADRWKGKHTGKVGLVHALPDGDITVGLSLSGCSASSGDKAYLRIFSRDVSLGIKEGMPFLCVTDCFFEFRRHVAADGELNLPEAGVLLCIAAPRHEIVLVPCRIGPESHGGDLFGKKRQSVDENTELFMACGDIAVPELRVEEKTVFRPVGIQG